MEALETAKNRGWILKFAIFAVVVVLGVAGIIFTQSSPDPVTAQKPVQSSETAIVTISVPDTLSESAKIGKTAFDANCVVCHGPNAVGQLEVAPPLIHKIYEPSHHGDEAFQVAVALGVREHHWPFGNMPPVEGLTRGDVQMIVAYIRELQRANGIN